MKLTVLDISEKDRIKTTTQFPAYILSKVLEEAGKLKKKKKKVQFSFIHIKFEKSIRQTIKDVQEAAGVKHSQKIWVSDTDLAVISIFTVTECYLNKQKRA